MYFDYTLDGVRKEIFNTDSPGVRDEEYIAMLSHQTSNLLELLEQLNAGSDLTKNLDGIIDLLLKNLSEPACVINEELDIIFLNDYWLRFGKKNENKILQTYFTKKDFSILRHAIDAVKIEKKRIILALKIGNKRRILSLLSFRGFNGIPKFLLLAFDDEIVNQIAYAEKHSSQFESAGEELSGSHPLFLDMIDGFYFMLNDQLIILRISGTVFPQLGHDQKALTGKKFASLLQDGDSEKVNKAIRNIAESDRELNSKIRIEIELADHENQYHPYQLILCRNTDRKGWLGVCLNIKDFKKHEEQLIREKNNAELNDRMKTDYLANMSHEIRTPLNGIVGFASMLDRDDLTAEKREKYVRIMRSSSIHLLALINDIIDLSKIEAGQIKIMDQKVDVHLLFEELLVTFVSEAKRLEKKNIRIIKQVTRSRSGLIIRGDEVRIKQVLSNFLGNALKFTLKGEICFGYSLETSGNITFFVRDSGLGIPPSAQQSVFDRFKQTREGSKEEYKGTGLGLAISKGIVELMGGQIGVRSEPGKGSEFFFTLPLEECE